MNTASDVPSPEKTEVQILTELCFGSMKVIGLSPKDQGHVFGHNIRSEKELDELRQTMCKDAKPREMVLFSLIGELAIDLAKYCDADRTKMERWLDTPDEILGFNPRVMLICGRSDQINRVRARLRSLVSNR